MGIGCASINEESKDTNENSNASVQQQIMQKAKVMHIGNGVTTTNYTDLINFNWDQVSIFDIQKNFINIIGQKQIEAHTKSKYFNEVKQTNLDEHILGEHNSDQG